MRSLIIFTIVVTIALAATSAPLRAEIEVSASVQPTAVTVGAEVELVVTITGKFRRSAAPELPDLPEFDFYEAGSSQQFSFVNGRQSSSIEYRYVLVPKKSGTYSIAPIRFTLDDKTYTAEEIKLEVVDAPAQLPTTTSDAAPGNDAESVGLPMYVLATVSQDTVYVNQQITWTLGFYTDGRTDLLRSPEYQPPSAEGFWIEDLPPQQNEYRMIDGRKYLVTQIKRAFFPTAPGIYKIGSARVDVVTNETRTQRSFDDFFRRGGFGFGKPRSMHSEEITVVVLPLPQSGRPRNFTGIVGRHLDVTLSADKQTVNAGDPVNVALEIRGEGNFKTIAAPALPDVPEFKKYESGSKSDLFKNNYIVSGRKKTDFVLIPRNAGSHEIPAVDVAYFDPVARQYRTVTSSPVHLSVQPASREEGSPVIFTGSGQDIEVLGRDINFIRPVPATLARGRSRLYNNPVVLALHALPLLALMASIVIEQRRRRWQGNASLARASRAARRAENSLAQARRSDGAAAHAMTAGALREYVADKSDVSAAGLTLDDVERFLADRGVDDNNIARVLSILRDCDAVQYSGAAATGDAERVIEETRTLIHDLEKNYMR